MPSSPSRQAELQRLGERPFAHRGLHGPGVVENSLSAVTAAVERGFGVEIDVQLSLDRQAMVFHDDQLDRLTGEQGSVAERRADALAGLRLAGSGDTIPSLGHALEAIGGRAPLLIEVKSPQRSVAPLCEAVRQAVERYSGPVGIMSFNPEVGAWFARRAPNVLRGLVVTKQGKSGFRGRIERIFSLWRCRADFLAYDIRDLPSAFAGAARARGIPVYTWTVRSEDDRARAAEQADQIIFEAPAE
jgi:glycerophosphoryl diester phosphodiesterase